MRFDRNLFISCFADMVKNDNFTDENSFGLWKDASSRRLRTTGR